MPKSRQQPEAPSPVGIVISEGKHDAAEPRVFAYVWGEVDDVLTAASAAAATSA